MKTRLHIFLVIAFCMMFSLIPKLYAQEYFAPEVYVKNIKLDKATYNTGDTIKGSFHLVNGTSAFTDKISYKVYLVGSFDKIDLPQKFYDFKLVGPLSLNPEEDRVIDFMYTLPGFVAGKDFGIQVQAFLQTDTPLGWGNSQKIQIMGNTSGVSLESQYISLKDAAYSLQAGPTVNAGDDLRLYYSIKNVSKTNAVITPKVTVVNRGTGEVVYSQNASSTSALAGSTTSNFIKLPISLSPQIYVGKVEFFGKGGEKVIENIEFRYIVGGDIFSVFSITSDKTSIKKGESLSVVIKYGGTPVDIVNRTPISQSLVKVTLKIFNENNEQVGIVEKEFNSNDGAGSLALPVKAEKDALALRGDVSFVKNGTVLKTEQVLFSGNYKELEKKPAENKSTFTVTYVIAGALVVIALLALLFKKRKAALIVLLIVFFAGFIQINSANAWSGVKEGGTGDDENWPHLNFSPSSPSGVYAVGETFRVQGTLTADSCGNQSSYSVAWKITYADQVKSGVINHNCSWVNGNRNCLFSNQFSSGLFTVRAGEKDVYIQFASHEYTNNDSVSTDSKRYLYGHQYIFLEPPANTVGSCSATGARVSWSAAPGASKYRVIIHDTSGTDWGGTGCSATVSDEHGGDPAFRCFNTTNTSYSWTPRTPGHSYYWYVYTVYANDSLSKAGSQFDSERRFSCPAPTYSCTGTAPGAGMTKCSDVGYSGSLAADTAWSQISNGLSCSNKCQYFPTPACLTGAGPLLPGQSYCTAYSCGGSIPANGTACTNAAPTTSGVSWSSVATCGSTPCTYSVAVATGCNNPAGGTSVPSGGVACPGTVTNPATPTNWGWVGSGAQSCGAYAGVCQYYTPCTNGDIWGTCSGRYTCQNGSWISDPEPCGGVTITDFTCKPNLAKIPYGSKVRWSLTPETTGAAYTWSGPGIPANTTGTSILSNIYTQGMVGTQTVQVKATLNGASDVTKQCSVKIIDPNSTEI